MPSTPRGYPYPTLSDAPDGPAQIQALATAIDTDNGTQQTAIDLATLREVKVYARPTPNAAPGSPGIGGNSTTTVASVVITDPGFTYKVEAQASLLVGIFSGANTVMTGIYLQTTLDEAAFVPTPDTRIINRAIGGSQPAPQELQCVSSFYRSNLTGSHTVHLLLRNESNPSNFLTYGDNGYYSFDVKVYPV